MTMKNAIGGKCGCSGVPPHQRPAAEQAHRESQGERTDAEMTTDGNPGLPLLPQYRDVKIEMVERHRQHWYLVDGLDDLLPSVTTMLKCIDRSGGMIGWAKKTTLAKVQASLLSRDAPGLEPGDYVEYLRWIDEVLDDSKNAPEEERDAAAEKGTTAHQLIAEILQGGNPSVPENLDSAVQGALRMIDDKMLTVEAVEVPVWHPKFEYAGTVDLVARDTDGQLVVVDWKRSKRIYDEHGYQTAAYAYAIAELTGEQVTSCYPVRLHHDESPPDFLYYAEAVEDVSAAFGTFLAAQNLWWALRAPIWKASPKKPRKKSDGAAT